jgi:17beta-estradiol 17-dehydrogenase / very-long-chain 3-oxoacyl-CoA reductase
VTGCTDGIGRGLSLEMAKAGYNLYLLGRNPEKLEDLKNQIKAENPNRESKVHKIDFAKAWAAEYSEVFTPIYESNNSIRPGEVSTLVNNVGVGMTNKPVFESDP